MHPKRNLLQRCFGKRTSRFKSILNTDENLRTRYSDKKLHDTI